jgi:hypothetical protein
LNELFVPGMVGAIPESMTVYRIGDQLIKEGVIPRPYKLKLCSNSQ